MEIIPSGATLGARVLGIDLAEPLCDADFRALLGVSDVAMLSGYGRKRLPCRSLR